MCHVVDCKKIKPCFSLILIPHTWRNLRMFSKVFCKPSTARSLASCYHGDRDPPRIQQNLKNFRFSPENLGDFFFLRQVEALNKMCGVWIHTKSFHWSNISLSAIGCLHLKTGQNLVNRRQVNKSSDLIFLFAYWSKWMFALGQQFYSKAP